MTTTLTQGASVTICTKCGEETIWLEDKKIYPFTHDDIDPPNVDLPDDIKTDYIEAAKIVGLSPRGSAALLRLCVEKLCNHLNGEKLKIDSAIEKLSSKGLPEFLQKALDIVRVTGNQAVHAGTLDMSDDVDTAKTLFGLVNLVSEVMITQPNKVEAQYNLLPINKLEGIENRKQRSKDQQNS